MDNKGYPVTHQWIPHFEQGRAAEDSAGCGHQHADEYWVENCRYHRGRYVPVPIKEAKGMVIGEREEQSLHDVREILRDLAPLIWPPPCKMLPVRERIMYASYDGMTTAVNIAITTSHFLTRDAYDDLWLYLRTTAGMLMAAVSPGVDQQQLDAFQAVDNRVAQAYVMSDATAAAMQRAARSS